jgi:hypothetical protein
MVVHLAGKAGRCLFLVRHRAGRELRELRRLPSKTEEHAFDEVDGKDGAEDGDQDGDTEQDQRVMDSGGQPFVFCAHGAVRREAGAGEIGEIGQKVLVTLIKRTRRPAAGADGSAAFLDETLGGTPHVVPEHRTAGRGSGIDGAADSRFHVVKALQQERTVGILARGK